MALGSSETERVVARPRHVVSAHEEPRTWTILALTSLISLLFHFAVDGALARIDVSALEIEPPQSTELTFDALAEEPEPPPEEEVVEDEPEPELERAEPEPEPVVRRPEPNDPAPEPPPLAEEPPPPEPLDLSGTVLTGTGDSSWSIHQGDGSDREGPIGPPPRRRGSPDGERGGTGGGGMGTGSGPRILPLADLSRRPSPPSEGRVAACMDRNYPRAARNQALEAVVRVRGRVMPDGSFTRMRIASESIAGQGFGDACLQCLRGQRWTPPLGPSGSPVATDVAYRCNFEMRN